MEKERCPICYDDMKLEFTTPCGHTFCYMCLKTAMRGYNHPWSPGPEATCPMCRQSLPVDIWEDVSLQKDVLSGILPLTQGQWMYEGRTPQSGWWYYDPVMTAALEEHYQKCILDPSIDLSIEIPILGRPYKITIPIKVDEMGTQTPLRGTGTVRNVKRIVPPLGSTTDLTGRILENVSLERKREDTSLDREPVQDTTYGPQATDILIKGIAGMKLKK
jgi:hypothetical protein